MRSLPHIEPYNLGFADHNGPCQNWTLDVDQAALLIHDMQHYFVDAFDRTPGAHIENAIRSLGVLRTFADDQDIPVIYTCQPPDQNPAERGLLADTWGSGIRTAEQARIIPELTPRPQDVVLTKWRYSAFEKTNLTELLTEAGKTQLLICGVYGHIGIQATAMSAFMQDFQPFIVSDAVADFSLSHHRSMERYVGRLAGKIASLNEILKSGRAPLVEVTAGTTQNVPA